MPTNTTILSYANPLEFWEDDFTPQAQFKSKHISDYEFEDTLLPWQEQNVSFKQVFQTNDSLRLQLRGTAGTYAWKLISCSGVVDSDNFVAVLQNQDNADEYIYQCDIDLSAYSAGEYRLQIDIANPVEVSLLSNIFILSEIVENSLLLAYSNSSFKDDVLWETGFSPVIRIKGHLSYKSPNSKDVVYEDQVLNETIVSSKAYDTYELTLNDERGIPDFFIRKMNCILGSDSLSVDGRYYTKSESARLEPNEIEGYPMRGWKIEMREQLNRRARYISTAGSTNLGLSVVLNTDSKGFIDGETGGSVYQIEDIQ